MPMVGLILHQTTPPVVVIVFDPPLKTGRFFGSQEGFSAKTLMAPHLNQIFNSSSESMDELSDESIHIVITSPPYNVNKNYEADQSFDDWKRLCRNVFTEMHRVLVGAGRVCINIANTGRNPYRPLHCYLIGIMLDLGFLMRGEIVWDKAASVGTSTAWGSWCSATNPCLRDVHEYILAFSKGDLRRDKTGEDTILGNQFVEYTRSVWKFPTESAKRIGHPSPFPMELPRRLINLYSFVGDTVLDPFCGSGQTCIAALELGRDYVGYDIVPEYCELARTRTRQAQESIQLENLRTFSGLEQMNADSADLM
jgi:site-specific DNA-methyltransferase (adenine-specific)